LGDDFESNNDARNVYQDLTRPQYEVIRFFLTQLLISFLLGDHFITDPELHMAKKKISMTHWAIAVLFQISCSEPLSGDSYNFRMWNVVLQGGSVCKTWSSCCSCCSLSFLCDLMVERRASCKAFRGWFILMFFPVIFGVFGVLALSVDFWWFIPVPWVIGFLFLCLMTSSFSKESLNADLPDESGAAAERMSFKSLGDRKMQFYWYVRRWFDIIINGLIRNQVLLQLPIMLCMENSRDFVLSCTAIFFLLTLDDLKKPIPLKDVWKKLKDQWKMN